MGASRLAWATAMTVAILAVAGCPKRTDPLPQVQMQSSVSPEQELQSFATERGGEWVPVLASLQGRNPELAQDSKTMSKQARELVQRFALSDSDSEFGDAPDLRHLPSLRWLQLSRTGIEDVGILSELRLHYLDLTGNRIEDVSGVPCRGLEQLLLGSNPISNIAPLSSCSALRELYLDGTEVRALPDLSGLRSLVMLNVGATPLESLDRIETIPGEFDLNVMRCERLQDIDALMTAHVKTLYMDEPTYQRLRPWFDEHIEEIKASRPGFSVKSEVIDGE